MKLNEIVNIIEERSPLSLQEGWDNSGWQVRVGNRDISRILAVLEVNGDVVEEAVRQGAELIVCHHPMIFGGIHSVDDKTGTGKLLIRLIENGISVYASHTPFDKCEGGNNDYLARLLDLRNVMVIPGDESGICRMGILEEPQTAEGLIRRLGERTGQDVRNYRLAGMMGQRISTVGICTGAGAEFADLAAAAGCDLFVTGDLKYHEAQHARDLSLAVLDMGHYGSEQIFTENMAAYLKKRVPDGIEILESKTDLNPFTVVERGNGES